MKTRADIGMLDTWGEPWVALFENDVTLLGGKLILKAYVNRETTKIRIVLPELCDFTQTLIDPEKHFVEFERVAKRRLK